MEKYIDLNSYFQRYFEKEIKSCQKYLEKNAGRCEVKKQDLSGSSKE